MTGRNNGWIIPTADKVLFLFELLTSRLFGLLCVYQPPSVFSGRQQDRAALADTLRSARMRAWILSSDSYDQHPNVSLFFFFFFYFLFFSIIFSTFLFFSLFLFFSFLLFLCFPVFFFFFFSFLFFSYFSIFFSHSSSSSILFFLVHYVLLHSLVSFAWRTLVKVK